MAQDDENKHITAKELNSGTTIYNIYRKRTHFLTKVYSGKIAEPQNQSTEHLDIGLVRQRARNDRYSRHA